MTMAVNAFNTYQQTGIKEQVSNLISNISPDETPLWSTLKKFSLKNRLYQWQTDSLAAPSSNVTLEGDVISVQASSSTVMLNNYSQISTKSLGVTDTAQSVDTYGRSNDKTYQTLKKGRELRTEVEVSLMKNVAKNAGSTTVGRVCGGLMTYISNTGLGTPNTTADGSSAATSATTGTLALTYEYCSSAMTQAYSVGGEPSIMMLPPGLKRSFSALAFATSTHTAVPRFNLSTAKEVTAVGAVDIWLSDFGTTTCIVNRQMSRYTGESSILNKTIFFLDPTQARVGILQDFEVTELAKRGLSDEAFIRIEYTLECTPNAHAMVIGAA